MVADSVQFDVPSDTVKEIECDPSAIGTPFMSVNRSVIGNRADDADATELNASEAIMPNAAREAPSMPRVVFMG